MNVASSRTSPNPVKKSIDDTRIIYKAPQLSRAIMPPYNQLGYEGGDKDDSKKKLSYPSQYSHIIGYKVKAGIGSREYPIGMIEQGCGDYPQKPETSKSLQSRSIKKMALVLLQKP